MVISIIFIVAFDVWALETVSNPKKNRIAMVISISFIEAFDVWALKTVSNQSTYLLYTL